MRRKLPLAIGALLFLAVGAFSALAYRQLAIASVVAAALRMGSVSTQLGALLAETETRARNDKLRPHADSVFLAYLARRNAVSERDALDALADYRRVNALRVAVELWDRDGRRLLASSVAGPGRRFDATTVSGGFPTHTLLGPILAHGDTVFIEARYPVVAGRDTVAVVRILQRVADPTTTATVRTLIGDDALLLIGNATGDVWTDMSRRESPPEWPLAGAPIRETTTADGRSWLAATAAVPGLPWVVWIALPRSAVLAPANALLRDLGVLALFIVGVGGFVAWLVGRRLTRPLDEVISAADGIAAGDYSQRVRANGDDEIGRLATAFNLMSARIQEAQADLEAQQAELEAGNQELSEAMRDAERAAEQLVAERGFLRQVIDTSPNFMFAKDREGRFTLANQAVADAYGTTPDALIGRTDADFNANAAEVDGYRVADMEVIDRGTTKVISEERITDSAGRTRWLHTVKRPIIGEDGRTRQLLGVASDITARKNLEAQLLQSQKMDAVGQLAGGVAHDFNNVLTAIKGFSELAAMQLEEGHAVHADILEIGAAADRAAALTQQLLAFSRRQLLVPVVLSPNTVVEGISKLLARLIGAEVQCETRLAPDVGLVRVDPGQLEQVLVNLAVNARDAMPGGGTLTIETSNATLDADQAAVLSRVEVVVPGRYVLLSVSDTGCGMSRATLGSIFEPFFTTKEPGKGTGLGLSTVYGIVRQSGGYVHVYSEPRHGSSFKVFLPCVDDAPSLAASPAREFTPHEVNETILLVDDDAGVRTATARILTRAGYAVITAASPREAEATWSAHPGPIHLLMTDVMMPEMDGGELARRLLATRPGARVLYTSGYTNEAVVGRGLITRETIFLAKPFTIEAVVRKAQEALAAEPGGVP